MAGSDSQQPAGLEQVEIAIAGPIKNDERKEVTPTASEHSSRGPSPVSLGGSTDSNDSQQAEADENSYVSYCSANPGIKTTKDLLVNGNSIFNSVESSTSGENKREFDLRARRKSAGRIWAEVLGENNNWDGSFYGEQRVSRGESTSSVKETQAILDDAQPSADEKDTNDNDSCSCFSSCVVC